MVLTSSLRSSHQVRARQAVRTHLRLETLEDRCVPAIYLVQTSGDSGGLTPTSGSGTAGDPYLIDTLRSAVEQTNATPSVVDTIMFDRSLMGDSITLTNGELSITDDISITGLGQDVLTFIAGSNSRVFDVDDGAASTSINVIFEEFAITGGDISGNGGGIRNDETLTVQNAAVIDNSADNGGGIWNVSGTLTIDTVVLADNVASTSGAGLFNSTGTVTVTTTTIRQNDATSDGGGIYNDDGDVTVIRTTLNGNTADGNGGGIHTNTGTEVVFNTTIANNDADNGGGWYNNASTATVTNVTVSGNTATGDGGGVYNNNGNITLGNSLLANNTGGDAFNASGTLTPDGVNLVEDASLTGTDILNVDPMLGALQNNGGPTETLLPQSGSPVVDVGNNTIANDAGLTSDQRGAAFPRIVNGTSPGSPQVDLGAVEVSANDTLAEVAREFGFRPGPLLYQNSYGFDEKWFYDRNGNWFTITPDGTIYDWQGVSGQLGTQVAEVSPNAYDDLTQLFRPSISLSSTTLQTLADLQDQYGFRPAQQLYFDSYGFNEKWFLDRDGNFFTITPDGTIYDWQGVSGLLGTQVAQVPSIVYDDLNRLLDPRNTFTNAQRQTLSSLRSENDFELGQELYQNSYGFNEKWLLDGDGNWFAITPDGTIYDWQGVSGQLGTEFAEVPDVVYDDLSLLLNAESTLTQAEREMLSDLAIGEGFQRANQLYQDSYGFNEKWFLDANGNYFSITPDGTIYEWNGVSGQLGTAFAQVSPAAYDNLELLVGPEAQVTPQTRQSLVALQAQNGFRLADQLFENSYGFEERWFLDADGNWFAITPDGTIYEWNGVSGQLGTVFAQVSPAAFNDLNLLLAPPVVPSVPAIPTGVQATQLVQLQRQFGFLPSNEFVTGSLGFNEVPIVDQFGNPFVLLPDGTIFPRTMVGGFGSPLAQISPTVFNNPNFLFDAPSLFNATTGIFNPTGVFGTTGAFL